jgi:hypothetical protein
MPVAVVFFRRPVARPDNAVPLIFPTVKAADPAELVASPVKAGSAEAGSPEAFVRTSAEGVPSAGVISVGDVDNTVFPVPVDVVTPVPPLATGSVPVTPVVRGKPVMLVATPDAGVPSVGVVSTGLVSVLLVSV